MTTTELEQVIQDYFLNTYKVKYIGKLDILRLNPEGYCIKFGMNTPDKPITIYAELDDSKFLKFLKLELKNKLFVLYGELNMYYPPLNYSCNDKR